MNKVIAVHSFKGGTGKTVVIVNLALTYAMKGDSVCMLDLDFRAPSLGMTFRDTVPEYTTNDYLDGDCSPKDLLVDVSSDFDTKGKLLLGLASHSTDKIQEYMIRGRDWGIKALKRLHLLKKELANDFGVDYVFLDASPGVQYTSINAVCVSDAVLLVTTLDESDIDGTKGMIANVYEPLEKKVFLLYNKCLAAPSPFNSPLGGDEVEAIKKMMDPFETRMVGVIPCFCEVLRSDRSSIFVLENPDHPFREAIDTISEKLADAL